MCISLRVALRPNDRKGAGCGVIVLLQTLLQLLHGGGTQDLQGVVDIYYPLEILRSTTVEELEQRLQEDYDPTTSALSVIWPQGNP